MEVNVHIQGLSFRSEEEEEPGLGKKPGAAERKGMKRMKIWHRLVVLLGSLIFLALAVFILFLVGQGPEKTFAFLQAQANPLHYLLVAIIFWSFSLQLLLPAPIHRNPSA